MGPTTYTLILNHFVKSELKTEIKTFGDLGLAKKTNQRVQRSISQSEQVELRSLHHRVEQNN